MRALALLLARYAAVFGSMYLGMPAHAVVSCGVATTSVNGTYAADNSLTLDGAFTITCSRSAGDAQSQTLYLGLNQPGTGRQMLQQGGSDTITYGLYRTRPNVGLWTDGAGRAESDASSGGLVLTMDFQSTSALAAQRVVPFYVHVPAGLNRHVGSYLDAGIVATLRLDTAMGAPLTSTLFTVGVQITDECRVTPPTAPLLINYTSFTTSSAHSTVAFDVTCTLGTPYTVALDSVSATMDTLAIEYRLELDATRGQGSAQPQTFRITGTASPGQRGRCAASICRASRNHSIVVTY